MSEEFKSPILVTGTLVPSGTQDVNVISPIPLPVTGTLTPSGTYDVNIVSSITLSTLITNSSLAVTGPLTDTELRATPVPVFVSNSVLVTQGTSPWIVDGSGSVQPISGTVAVSNFPPIQPVSGTVTALQGTSPWITDGSGTVQPVSGTVTANIGTTGGLALDNTLTSGAQKSQIINSSDVSVDARAIGTTPVDTDIGLVTNSIIYGHTTAGGGSYVEVKVTPSGALTADVSGSSVSITNFPAVQPISGTVTANQGTSPWVISGAVTNTPPANQSINLAQLNGIALGSPSNYGTSPGAVEAIGVNAFITNIPAVTLTSTTITGTVAVTQSTSPWVVSLASTTLTGTSTVAGNLTNNNAAPVANNLGVLPGLANASNPSWTEGDQVLLSEDLSGNLRVKVNAALPAGTNVIGHIIADSGSTTAVTGNVTVVQPTGTNLHTVLDSGTLTAITNALPSGSNVIGHIIADSGSTTVVTGNVAVVQATGTNLHTVVDSGSITVNNASGASAVNIQDGGNSITVDGTVTSNQGTANTVANSWPVKVTDGTDTVSVDTDGSLFVKPVPVGTHANAWNAASVSSGGNSSVIDCQYASTISIFGNVSSNLNPLRIQASQDNSNFYTLTTISATTGNFGITIDFGARYLRLQSGQGGGAVTITATIAGK